MDFNSQYTWRTLSNSGRTNHSMIVIDWIASCSQSGTCWFSISHIITIHFISIDICNNSITIVELEFNSSHSTQSNKRFTEVLSISSWCSCSSKWDFSPTSIRITHILPASWSTWSVLPSILLVDGRIQRQWHLLGFTRCHHSLEYKISIDSIDLKPGTTAPIGGSIIHSKSVLIVCSLLNTCFNCSFFGVCKRRRIVKWGCSRQDWKGFLTCQSECLLNELDIDLATCTVHSNC